MIKKQILGFFPRQIACLDYNLMALLNKDPFFLTSHWFSQGRSTNELTQFPGKALFDAGSSIRIDSSNRLSLRGCCNCSKGFSRRTEDEFHKAHALPPYPELVHDSKSGFDQVRDTRFAMNGSGAYKHGNPLKIPNCVMPEKLIVAVDVDEVLGSFVSALNRFIADRYSSNHTVSEYHVYEFFKIWNCSRDEANIRVHEFFKTSYFKTGIHPIPGSQRTLHNLSSFCNLSIVTSRQNVIKDHTIEWVEKHYPGLFKEIHFGNHFALDGQSRPKSDICRSFGAQVLIDDNPRYAVDCAEAGIRVLLFDYENSYPWCKTGSDNIHPLVTKVHNWEEIEEQLMSMECILDSQS